MTAPAERGPEDETGEQAMNQPETVEAALSHLPAKAAKLAAVEVLLSDPESLQDDTLESCLYLLRERLRGTAS